MMRWDTWSQHYTNIQEQVFLPLHEHPGTSVPTITRTSRNKSSYHYTNIQEQVFLPLHEHPGTSVPTITRTSLCLLMLSYNTGRV